MHMLAAVCCSPTDPIAVVSVLRDVGASKQLCALVEGESLFNDGSAFVLVLVFRQLLTVGESVDAGAITLTFLRLAVGGPAFGLLCGVST